MPKEVLLEEVLLEKQAPEAGHVRGLAEVGAIDCAIHRGSAVAAGLRDHHSAQPRQKLGLLSKWYLQA